MTPLLLVPVSVVASGCACLFLLRSFRHDERWLLPPAWKPRVVGLTTIFAGLLALRTGSSWELPVLLLLPTFGVLLGAIDLHSRLLPNALVVPFLGATLAVLIPGALLTQSWLAIVGSLAGGAVMFAIYLVLALISPGKLGMGDVKLAGILGILSGLVGLDAWTATVLGGFFLGGLIGTLLLVTGRSLNSAFPFGPAMLAAALAAVLIWT